MEASLDRLHAGAHGNPFFQRLAIVSRILLALAFIPTGMVKLLGERFTTISTSNPIGMFFEALYQTGAFWNFIGGAQVVAGILLLIPWTTTLGALMFLPIVTNVFVITVSLRFGGTPVITGLMVLACVFLVCWDYDRWKGIIFPPHRTTVVARLSRLERAGYIIGALAGLGVLGWTRGLVPGTFLRAFLIVGVMAAGMVLVAWVRAMRLPARVLARE